jgi:predicted alpha/beta hydrolase
MAEDNVTLSEIKIHTRDGKVLAATLFAPHEARRAVVINSATAVPRHLYRRFATWLATQGLAVLTYDYRGVADSASQVSLSSNDEFWHWGHYDCDAALTEMQQRYPEMPLCVLGHSIGGLCVAYVPSPERLTHVVTVGAQKAYWRDWRPRREQLKMVLTWGVMTYTLTHLFGYFPGKKVGFAMNLHRGLALTWAKACFSDDVPRMNGSPPREQVRACFDNFRVPITAYSLSDDPIGTYSAIERLLNLLVHARKEHRHRTPQDFGQSQVGHFGFPRPVLETTFWVELLTALCAN